MDFEVQIIPSHDDPSRDAVVIRRSRIIGIVNRGDGLWRNSSFMKPDGTRISGLSEIISAVSEENGIPFVMLESHLGYLTVYDRTGRPAARILSCSDGHRYRRFEPHASETFPDLRSAIVRAMADADR